MGDWNAKSLHHISFVHGPARAARFVFLYILSQEPTGPQGGGGWHIETVKVVDDKKLLEAVESSCAQQRAAGQDDE